MDTLNAIYGEWRKLKTLDRSLKGLYVSLSIKIDQESNSTSWAELSGLTFQQFEKRWLPTTISCRIGYSFPNQTLTHFQEQRGSSFLSVNNSFQEKTENPLENIGCLISPWALKFWLKNRLG